MTTATQTIWANAFRFGVDKVIRQYAPVEIRPVIFTPEHNLLGFRQPDQVVAFEFIDVPDSCRELLCAAPRALEFWTHARGWNPSVRWVHFFYPYTAWSENTPWLEATPGKPVPFPDMDPPIEVTLGGFRYMNGPLPKGPRRRRGEPRHYAVAT